MKRIYASFIVGCSLFFHSNCYSQLVLTNASSSDTIDFSSSMQTSVGSNPSTAYNASGLDTGPTSAGKLNSNAWAVTGWSVDGDLTFGGTKTTSSTCYTRGSVGAAPNQAGFYAYTGSPASSTDPIFLIQPGGLNFAPGTLTLRVKNGGTTNITSLAFSYDLYNRNDQFRSNSFNFSYSTDDSAYTAVSSLDYTSSANPNSLGLVLIGTSPSRSTTITGLNVPPNSYIYLRWSSDDVGGSGSRDEFGLDNIVASATFAAVSLPIRLISFEGIHSARGLQLKWTIACSQSLEYFEVEKALDGQTFTNIARVDPSEGDCAGEEMHTYTDAEFAKSAAYRLQIHELNGEVSTSDIRYFRTGNTSPIVRLMPNPVVCDLHVSGLVKGTTWHILDSYGVKVSSGVAIGSEDIVDANDIAPGLYFFVSPDAMPVKFVKK